MWNLLKEAFKPKSILLFLVTLIAASAVIELVSIGVPQAGSFITSPIATIKGFFGKRRAA